MKEKKELIIAVDFDGTIVTHEYPSIGHDVGAFFWLKKFTGKGVKLILWTMRSGQQLDEALAHLKKYDVPIWGINKNPDQKSWSQSPKAYANLYIDDAAFGCPVRKVPVMSGREFVNWDEVGPKVMEWIKWQQWDEKPKDLSMGEVDELMNALPVIELPDYTPQEDIHVSPPPIKHPPIDPSLLPDVEEAKNRQVPQHATPRTIGLANTNNIVK